MDFFCLQKFVQNLDVKLFNFTVIGKSMLGRPIYAIKTKTKSKKCAIITAGMHARENLACDVVCKMIKLFEKTKPQLPFSVVFVPMVNPDGVELCNHGTSGLVPELATNLEQINGSNNFELFKANIAGVDLNNNFDANWNQKFTDKTKPSSQGYYGEFPLCAPEAKLLWNFTKKLKPFISISYHMKGEEIYFDFWQKGWQKERDKKIAQIFAKSTGYVIKSTQSCSSGGYKDACVQKLKIPALTIELGDDKFAHPYPISELGNIFAKNCGVFDCLASAFLVYNNFEEKYGNKIYEKGSCSCTKSIFK